jgi:hypothetical protein
MAWQVGAAVGGGGTSFALRCPTRWRLTPGRHGWLRWPCGPAHRPRADRSATRAAEPPPSSSARRWHWVGPIASTTREQATRRSAAGQRRPGQASRPVCGARAVDAPTRATDREHAPGLKPGVVHLACLRSQLTGIAPRAHVDAHHNGSARHWLLGAAGGGGGTSFALQFPTWWRQARARHGRQRGTKNPAPSHFSREQRERCRSSSAETRMDAGSPGHCWV